MSRVSVYQLPLQVKLNDTTTFGNFYIGDNAQLLGMLQAAREPSAYFWSAEPAGKSHLLQAVCHAVQSGFYLPLSDWQGLEPAILEGLEQFDFVCLDDLHAIAGRAEWETRLFHLYNRIRDSSGHLYISARAAPPQLGIKLADLLSRLGWGPVYHLQPLNDAQKVQALQMRATRRGFDMSDEVANYLLNHCPRDLHNLFAILDKLDDASLQAQRRLTVPFIKSQLQV